uniref:BAG domain-containing protein n=1 Tax=Syphacia muris TaxID=451379 RepID=A0A0N5AVL6_9BILA
MRLNVICGQLHFPVYADVLSDGDSQLTDTDSIGEHVTTFGALKEFIAETAQVDPKVMRIIHRVSMCNDLSLFHIACKWFFVGRTLVGNDSDSLEIFKFKRNDKLLVMGKVATIGEDEGWKVQLFGNLLTMKSRNYFLTFLTKLSECEKKNMPTLGKKYDQNEQDLAGLEKNYLEGPQCAEAIKKMERRLNQFTEDCLKQLEHIDGLEIVSERTSDEQAQKNREKRKELINGIQDLLNRNDKFVHRLKDYQYKVEHPEEKL